MKKILLVRPGSALPEIRALHGDFDQWFVRALKLSADAYEVVDPTRGERPGGSPDGYGGVLITGSHADAFGSDPWIGETERLVRSYADRQTPMLGVCFGAQIIATALGGRVVRNPRGKEMGTVRIELTDTGRRSSFLGGLPAVFPAQSSHNDCVDRLPDGAELLASNAWAEVQAYSVGPSIHAVQFHPEILPEMMHDIIRYWIDKGEVTADEGRELERQVEPAPTALSLLHRFVATTGDLEVGATSRCRADVPGDA